MNGASRDTVLTYLGWSGFCLRFPDGQVLCIDPPDAHRIPLSMPVCLAVTHGHPEHISGTAGHLRNPARTGAAAILASPGLCRYLARWVRPGDSLIPCRPGDEHAVRNISVDVFRCRHMPLLPPERGAGIERIRQIASNPALAASIVGDVIRCPLPGPTLGFRFRHTGAPAVLFYGEGLHRGAGNERIADVAERLPANLLIAAVEPEDAAMMPDLMATTGTETMVPYEAHRPWRCGFGMPCADLDNLAARLVRGGHKVVEVTEGVPVRLETRGRS